MIGGSIMRNIHHPSALRKDDLVAISQGRNETTIDDMEFFETLAHSQCLVMPPWVYHVNKEGRLEKVTAVRYTPEYSLDKASILLAVMNKLPSLHS